MVCDLTSVDASPLVESPSNKALVYVHVKAVTSTIQNTFLDLCSTIEDSDCFGKLTEMMDTWRTFFDERL